MRHENEHVLLEVILDETSTNDHHLKCQVIDVPFYYRLLPNFTIPDSDHLYLLSHVPACAIANCLSYRHQKLVCLGAISPD